MTQTVPATAALGPGKTGLTMGLRVLNLDGTTYATFSAVGVAETSTAGTYRKAGGVVCPDAGGYIVWGVSGTDYAEATVDPGAASQASVDDLPTNSELATALAGADDAVLAAVADVPTVAEFEARTLAAASYATAAALATVDGIVDDILVDTGTTLPAAIAGISSGSAPTVGEIDAQLSATHGAGSWEGSSAGSGTGSYTDTITDGTDPLDGVRVQLSTDSAGASMAYEAYTNALGVFALRPDPGTYYRWLDLAGYTFTQGVEVTVT